jgi:tRNA threonylcarbamoyladenosine modification (KEOPS) complex Cgi121 subunit
MVGNLPVRCYRLPGSADPVALREALQKEIPGLLTLAVNEVAVSNEAVVEMLVAQTLRAASTDNLLARKREVDLLLRIAGTTQISAALRNVGAQKGKPFVIILAGTEKELEVASTSGLLGNERTGKKELEKSELKLVERAALLNAERG